VARSAAAHVARDHGLGCEPHRHRFPLDCAGARQRFVFGDYVCDCGCRLTDAAPSIAVNGGEATCWNEFGGVFHGRLLSERSVFCFNKVGTLSEDGTTIRWDGGAIWRRVPPRPR